MEIVRKAFLESVAIFKKGDDRTMKIKQTVAAIVAALALFGCGVPAVISDLETDKVVIQSGFGTTDQMIKAQATKGCGLHGRVPVLISVRCVDDYQYCTDETHLFACVEP